MLVQGIIYPFLRPSAAPSASFQGTKKAPSGAVGAVNIAAPAVAFFGSLTVPHTGRNCQGLFCALLRPFPPSAVNPSGKALKSILGRFRPLLRSFYYLYPAVLAATVQVIVHFRPCPPCTAPAKGAFESRFVLLFCRFLCNQKVKNISVLFHASPNKTPKLTAAGADNLFLSVCQKIDFCLSAAKRTEKPQRIRLFCKPFFKCFPHGKIFFVAKFPSVHFFFFFPFCIFPPLSISTKSASITAPSGRAAASAASLSRLGGAGAACCNSTAFLF